jgi:hypothetical protein
MDEWATAFALDDHLLYVAAGGASDVRSTRPPVRTSTDGSTSARGSGPPAPPPLARLVTLDVTDPEKPVSAAPGEPWGWPSAAAADEDWVVAASTLGAGMPYPRRLALLGPTDHHLPLPWHVTGAAMAYPQVFLAAGAAGLIGAHVEHPAGPLATPTPWASTTPEPTSTTSPTTAARGFRIMLPATEAGS